MVLYRIGRVTRKSYAGIGLAIRFKKTGRVKVVWISQKFRSQCKLHPSALSYNFSSATRKLKAVKAREEGRAVSVLTGGEVVQTSCREGTSLLVHPRSRGISPQDATGGEAPGEAAADFFLQSTLAPRFVT